MPSGAARCETTPFDGGTDLAQVFNRDLRDRLPRPLARLYVRAFNAKSALERHLGAFYLFEAAVKLAAAAQIAVYLAHGERDPAIDRRLVHLAMPSLGHWVEFLREVSKRTAASDPHPFPEIAGTSRLLSEAGRDLPDLEAAALAMVARVPLSRPRGGAPSAGGFLDLLPDYRNKVIGHGGQRDQGFYVEMGEALLAAVTSLLDRVPLFGRSVLVYASDVREKPDGSREVELWDLTGTDILQSLRAEGSAGGASGALRPGRLCLRSGEAFLDLHPLLVCELSPPLDAAVLFLNRSSIERRVEYLEYVSGQVSLAPQLLDDHRRILGRILGHEISSERLRSLADKSVSDSPDPPPDAAVAVVRRFGEFELVAKLGEGGMGTVYLSRQRSLGRLVALKVLPLALSADDVAVARFQREIQALARADDPHVVRILQSGFTEGQHWFAMEYVDGCDLREVAAAMANASTRGALTAADLSTAVSQAALRRRKETPEAFPEVPPADRPAALTGVQAEPYFPRLARIFHDAASGLEHLHRQGILHRDLKPANLMLTSGDNRAVVMDLGLARLAGQATLTRADQVIGTIRYSAPEQLQHALVTPDHRADVYSLGASLYELATGRPPFEAPSTEALIARVLRDIPPPPRRIDRAVPADLDAIIRKAMDPTPDRRYASARSMAEDLGRYFRGEPVLARPPGLGRLLRLWARRHAAAAVIAAVSLLVIISGTAFFIRALAIAKTAAEEETTRTQEALAQARSLGLAVASGDAGGRDPMLALLLAREAVHTSPTSPAIQSLHDALVQSHERVRFPGDRAVFSPSGDRILTATRDRTDLLDNRVQLWDLQGRKLRVLRGHWGAISCIVFSPSGNRILTASRDKTVRLWNLEGRELAELRGHEGFVQSAVFSPSGDRILTASEDKTARLWDLEGHELAVLRGHEGYVQSTTFSPFGDRILTASDKTARLWDREGHELAMLRGHEGGVYSAIFSPSSDRILTASEDKTARLWDLEGHELTVLRGHEGGVSSAIFSPSGERILTSSGDKSARLWDLEGHELAVLRGHERNITSAVFSPAGDRMLTASGDKTARLWDLEGHELAVLRGHEWEVSAIFSPSGDRILTASWDQIARLWHLEGYELAVLRGHEGYVESAVSCPSSDRILTASRDKTARLWDLEGHELAVLRGHESGVFSANFSPSGERILTASDITVLLWDLEGHELAALRGHEGFVYSAMFSPSGDGILTASGDQTARLWDLEGHELAALRGHDGDLYSAIFSSSGDRILTASEDKTARLWDLEGNELAVLRGHEEEVTSAIFSPSGDRILTASRDESARLWDLEGHELAVLRGHENNFSSAVFSPSGDRILTANRTKTARLWDLEGRELAVMRGHEMAISTAVFSPSGDRVLTASDDTTARLWDLDGRELAVLSGHVGPVASADFSLDGRMVLTASNDRTARVWLVYPEDLLELSKSRIDREFTAEEREKYAALLQPR